VVHGATDLRGGDSSNSGFLRRFFLDLMVKKYENWSTFAEVLPFGAGGGAVIMTHRVYMYLGNQLQQRK